VLRPILNEPFEIVRDKSEYVVAAPQYRVAANTARGRKNSSLHSELARLFHSLRANRQRELPREFLREWRGEGARKRAYVPDVPDASGIGVVRKSIYRNVDYSHQVTTSTGS
jgi:hypothetical protein